MAELLFSAEGIEVWHGNSLDADDVDAVMGDRVANMFCADAPYSERTHSGHRAGKVTEDRARGFAAGPAPSKGNRKAVAAYAAKVAAGLKARADLEYTAWTVGEVQQLCAIFAGRVNGWWASITDHELWTPWERTFGELKLLTFAPLPWVETGSRVRLLGDGPSNWTCWLVVGRPRTETFARWGTLQGAYIIPGENHQNRPDRITGAKSLRGMMMLLQDYSREGDLVVDPVLGGGTTAVAAWRTGRRCIGIEQDRGRAELCAELVRAEVSSTTRVAMQRGQCALFNVNHEENHTPQ